MGLLLIAPKSSPSLNYSEISRVIIHYTETSLIFCSRVSMVNHEEAFTLLLIDLGSIFDGYQTEK